MSRWRIEAIGYIYLGKEIQKEGSEEDRKKKGEGRLHGLEKEQESRTLQFAVVWLCRT